MTLDPLAQQEAAGLVSHTEPKAYPHPRPRPEWLALNREAALDPAQRIIDAHHHLWDRPGEPYGLDDLAADAATGHDIRGSVFVQCGWSYRTKGPPELRPVGETEAVVAASRQRGGAFCQGIVGYADLRMGDRVAAVLEAHLAAGEGRFRGIRQSTADDPAVLSTLSAKPTSGLMADGGFRRGFSCLGRFGLAYDAWLYHPQFDELAALMTAESATTVVLDHLGGPLLVGPYAARREAAIADWREGLRRLARHPNLFVKIGGLGRAILGFDFHTRPAPPSSETLAAAWRPFVEATIDIVGPGRCMFESNFPVDKGMCGYTELWNAFKRIAAGYAADERDALFHGTAARVYRLDGLA